MHSFFSTSVKGGEQAIAKALLAGIANFFNKALDEVMPSVREAVAESVGLALLKSPEYAAITDGPIWHELGIPNPVATVGNIIEQIKRSVSIKRSPVSSNVNASEVLTVGILPADYNDILSLPDAEFISSVKRKKGEAGRLIATPHRVEWLKWLLIDGGSLVITNYAYQPIASRNSRTGFGVMADSNQGWTVPQAVAGTSEDNWLTRAIHRNLPTIIETLQTTINKGLS